jgi:ubiquinol-cytochrome c reductase cytochrome b subunit
MIEDPDHDARFGRTAYEGDMPSMVVKPKDADASWKPMSEADVKATAAFLAGDRGSARGKDVVKTRCTTCHLYEGEGDDGGEGVAPELAGWGSVAWLRAQIANPSSKATYREKAFERKGHMPRFDAEMNAKDIDVLAEWVHAAAKK